MLFQFAANFSGRHIISHRVNGTADAPKLFEVLEANGFTPLRTHKIFKGQQNTLPAELREDVDKNIAIKEEFMRSSAIYTTDWSFVMVVRNTYNPGYDLHIMDASDDKRYVRLFEDVLFGMFTDEKEKEGSIFALMMNDGSLDLAKLGEVTDPLVRENYTEEVLENFDHIIACLGSKTPCGRISLLNGPPGTGKSFMIRSLIHLTVGVHIIIPGGMITEMTGPNLLSILHGAHQGGKPLVLIIEDADLLLVDRKAGNLRVLSDLLNLGDGLLGQMLDIRIVASTNAKKIELDEAVTRPGRMCRHSTIGTLTFDQAKTIYTRLTGKEATFRKRVAFTLAEIYRLARQDGWTAPVEKPLYEGGNYA
jgi:hypothetical protein